MADVIHMFQNGGVCFDGGLGSMLIAAGLEPGWPPEEWNLSHPDVVRGVHRDYLQAGAQVITTNTFGATPSRLSAHDPTLDARAVTAAGIRLVRDAIAGHAERTGEMGRLCALSLGPTGKMLPPVGNADEDEVRAEYQAQIAAVHEEPPDLIVIETMIDLREALIALGVAKTYGNLPVSVALTYNPTPRGFFTVMGNAAEASVATIVDAGADIVAANCSIASDDMLELAALLRGATSLPLLCQPNAGSPTVRGGAAVYDQSPGEYATHAMELFDLGVNAVGGCCGTTPAFIAELTGRMQDGVESA